eukprot:IDg980t1
MMRKPHDYRNGAMLVGAGHASDKQERSASNKEERNADLRKALHSAPSNRGPLLKSKRARGEEDSSDGGRAHDERDIPVLVHRLSCGAYESISLHPETKWYRVVRRRVGSYIPATPFARVIDSRFGLPAPSSEGSPLLASSAKRLIRERDQARSSSMLFSMSDSMGVKVGREEVRRMRASFKRLRI